MFGLNGFTGFRFWAVPVYAIATKKIQDAHYHDVSVTTQRAD